MLALAGLPGTAGFIGKFFLIEATVEGDFTWLGVVIVIGSMISLAYYLRVVAAVWMRPRSPRPARVAPVMAGGSPEADAHRAALDRRAAEVVASRCSRPPRRLLRDRSEPAAGPRLGRGPRSILADRGMPGTRSATGRTPSRAA